MTRVLITGGAICLLVALVCGCNGKPHEGPQPERAAKVYAASLRLQSPLVVCARCAWSGPLHCDKDSSRCSLSYEEGGQRRVLALICDNYNGECAQVQR